MLPLGRWRLPEIARLVDQHKQAFRDRLSTIAAAAGAARPAVLGRHLALLYEGANALAASRNDPEAFAVAREVAKTLLELALTDVPED